MIRSVAVVGALAVALSAGCSQVDSPAADAAPVNALCPIMGHEIAAAGGTTTWNGQTIGFCCDGCLPKWNKLSEDGKAAKIAEPSKTDHDHSEHET